MSYDESIQLQRTVQTNDTQCLTTWSKLDLFWEEVRFKDLMQVATPTKAHYAIFEAEQGFTTYLPLDAAMDNDVLVEFKTQGRALESEHGGPVRMLMPSRYFNESEVVHWDKANTVRRTRFLGNPRIFKHGGSLKGGKIRRTWLR